MSLFKLREAWSTRFPDEEFETRGMCVGDVLNGTGPVPAADAANKSTNKKDDVSLAAPQQQIVVGSFQGVVRVYLPTHKGSQAGDLLLEHDVGNPVLQVGIAPVQSTPSQNLLVVLCPRRLLFVKIAAATAPSAAPPSSPEASAGQHDDDDALMSLAAGTHYSFLIVADIVLQRTAHSFCTGLFGRPPSRLHGVCVQSMDGNLEFYSGAHASFNRFLPSSSFLVPGALAYVESVDTFYVGTSTFAVEAFAFTTLAGASGSETRGDDKTRAARKLVPDWSFVVGEDILAVRECRLSEGRIEEGETEVAVLAEHSFVLLNSRLGTPVLNLRLDYAPMCMAVFPRPADASGNNSNNNKHQLILCSATGSYYVHSGNKIIWSAKGTGNAPPIACDVARAALCRAQGMIVLLSDDGVLSLSYLGTDPANQAVQVLAREELDVAATLRETQELQRKIHVALSGGIAPPLDQLPPAGADQAAAADDEPPEPLEITCDAPTLDYGEGLVSTHFYVYSPGARDLRDIVIAVSGSDPIASACHSHTIAFLPGRSRVSVPISFGIKPELQHVMPASLLVEAVATYTATMSSSSPSSAGASKTIVSRTSCALPLGLVCRPQPQIKNSPFKIQIDVTNRTTVPLISQMFDDIAVFSPDLVTSNTMSVQFCNGADATVLLSKNGCRYRVQSSHFAGLWLLTSELLRRLRKVLGADGEAEPTFELPDDIPLEDLYGCIDAHFAARTLLADASKTVASLSEQLRAVQRRLIARFREPNPAPMHSMQKLFEVTYRSLRDACAETDRRALALKAAAAALACGVHMTLLVSKYKLQLGREDFEMLRNFLSPSVDDSATNEVGWEETTVTGLTHLLRTSLSKTRVEAGAIVAQPLAIQTDTSRVRKNIALVYERLVKGAKLADQEAERPQ